MSIFQYLQPQPIDPQDDGTTSAFDEYTADETIDLSQEVDGEELVREWTEMEQELHENQSVSNQ